MFPYCITQVLLISVIMGGCVVSGMQVVLDTVFFFFLRNRHSIFPLYKAMKKDQKGSMYSAPNLSLNLIRN
jgi:hypothetical protein